MGAELMNLETDRHQTDEELVAQMKTAFEASKQGTFVTTSTAEWDDDPRELWTIPEYQQHCRRLVAFGFVGLLTPTTTDPRHAPRFLRGGPFFGGFEVWACSMNYNLPRLNITPEIDAAFRAAPEVAVRVAAENLARFPHVPAAPPAAIIDRRSFGGGS
jgi:hypothetical protein